MTIPLALEQRYRSLFRQYDQNRMGVTGWASKSCARRTSGQRPVRL
jgi:hypothetical protein